MKYFVLSIIPLLVILVLLSSYNAKMETFQDLKMRPWFGYEPGLYGPGWGRKGCSSDKFCMKD
jgi:hypothetical protein